jgi:mono/diheme cytochrome c family protein
MSKCLRLMILGTVLLFGSAPMVFAESVVPGLIGSKLEAELKGQVLIEELNCVACHVSSGSLAASSKKAPLLSEVGSRVNPYYIETFIRDPHATKSGTTMPDVLKSLSDQERKLAAKALTHFLLSLKKNDFSLQPPDAVAAQQGKTLFSSRGCVQCHASRDDKGMELADKRNVPLGSLEKKYSFKSLVDFLRQPHASRPSGRMPDMRLSGQDLERIANFLLQNTQVPGALSYTLYRGQVWEGIESDKVRAERAGQVKDFNLASLGVVQHHTAIKYDGWINLANQGSYTFFLKMNGGSLSIDGKMLIQQDPSDRRGVKDLKATAELAAGWRKIQLTYFHTGQSERLSFEIAGPQLERQLIPSSMLSISNQEVPALVPLVVDADLAARGREMFGTFGCANCHNDLGVTGKPAPAFAKLDSSKGCLSEKNGAWPRYDLNADQRGLIVKAMPHAEQPELTDKQRINKTLVTFNCITCHDRTGLGGITPDHNALFTGTQGSLGDQGRLPPPLTQVGAKLKPEWIREVLLNGKRQRAYLDASMPQFGEANVGHLVELFGKVDELEVAAIPKINDLQESKKAGCELVGTNGLSCIACHEFNGQKSGEIGAVDIARVGERLKQNWFHLYLRQPSRFHPTVIMPSYWPNGQSVRPNILGGDSGQQIEALWVYLGDGIKAKKPMGLSRQTKELRVSDVTEICRGQGPIGYRGIGVGYPERINLGFDSGEMALRQLWKGDFADVDLGNFNPRGTNKITFPPGIPFERLKSMEESWPYKGKTNYTFPQDHGYQFRGYRLDATRRPTFMYRYGDIAVEDYFEDLHDQAGKAYFKRTFTFETPTEQTLFYFRAAVGKKITPQSERNFTIDQLQLRITSENKGVVRDGDSGELLIPLTLPKGRSTLTLEYQW